MVQIQIFPNGNIAAFDDKGHNVLNIDGQSWFSLVFQLLEKNGLDPEACDIKTVLNSQIVSVIPKKLDEEHWGYKITPVEC